MERQAPDKIDYLVHEDQMVRMERVIKRLWILCIIIFIAFVGSNCAWLYYESLFTDEIVTEEMSQDVDTGNGDATVNGHIGDYYGTGETDA
jgi:hypothetical protein